MTTGDMKTYADGYRDGYAAGSRHSKYDPDPKLHDDINSFIDKIEDRIPNLVGTEVEDICPMVGPEYLPYDECSKEEKAARNNAQLSYLTSIHEKINTPKKKPKQIAFGDAKSGKVNIWCDELRYLKDGTIKFNVINGAWYGRYKDGVVTVDVFGNKFATDILWEGYMKGHYNDAITKIEEEIGKSKVG